MHSKQEYKAKGSPVGEPFALCISCLTPNKQKNPTMRRFHIVGIKQEKEGGNSLAPTKSRSLGELAANIPGYYVKPVGTGKTIMTIAKFVIAAISISLAVMNFSQLDSQSRKLLPVKTRRVYAAKNA